MKVAPVLVVLSILFIGLSDAYEILVIFPSLGKSQHIIGSALARGLAEKGHEVTMIAAFPTEPATENVHDIVTRLDLGMLEGAPINFYETDEYPFEELMIVYKLGAFVANSTLGSKGVQKLMNSNQTFDIIICEAFAIEAFLGFSHHFHAPVISLSTLGASGFTAQMAEFPGSQSYIPNLFLPYTDKMTLLERIFNIMTETIERLLYEWYHIPIQEKIYNEYFRDPKPSLRETINNISLVLLNTHFSLSFPRPYATNVIEVGGLHINRKSQPLPADIQSFIDSAKFGVIYFSMGTNLRGVDLAAEKRNAILAVFGSLKQKVLWKWEDESLPGKPNNVLIKSWFPQDDILAQPNVKLFITHGGLLSTTESIYHGVPIVGIPVFGDQHLNMARAEKIGIGVRMDLKNLDEVNFKAAVIEVLTNEKYTHRVKKMSELFRDQPQTPLDSAIFWVEYIARHGGAPHMKSTGQELSCIQYYNIDALMVIFTIIIIFIYALRRVFSMIRSVLCGSKQRCDPKVNIKKRK